MTDVARVTLDQRCLRVSGDIDSDNVMAVREDGERLIRDVPGGDGAVLTVDLSDLGVAHSIVLSLLLCWLRAAQSRQIAVRMVGANGRLLSLAELSGLSQHLPGFEPAHPVASSA